MRPRDEEDDVEKAGGMASMTAPMSGGAVSPLMAAPNDNAGEAKESKMSMLSPDRLGKDGGKDSNHSLT